MVLQYTFVTQHDNICLSQTGYRKWNKGSVVSLFEFMHTVVSFFLCSYAHLLTFTEDLSLVTCWLFKVKPEEEEEEGFRSGEIHFSQSARTHRVSKETQTNLRRIITTLLYLFPTIFNPVFFNESAALNDMLVHVSKTMFILFSCMLLQPVSIFKHFLTFSHDLNLGSFSKCQ